MTTYIILLRAVNVGGHNKIKMAELKEALLAHKNFEDVMTYIQSGNIILNSALKTQKTTQIVAEVIQKTFDLNIDVVSVSKTDWTEMADKHSFEDESTEQKQLLVTFLFDDIEEKIIKEALSTLPDNEFCESKKTFLYSFYPNGYGNSKFNNNFIQKKLKTKCTTRNWKTIKTLSDKLDHLYS